MYVSVMLAALFVSASASSATVSPPVPAPAIIWVKADGPKEVVRIAFLGFDEKRAPHAPQTLDARLTCSGRTMPVKLHRSWQGIGAVRGGWVPADYSLDVPHGATGAAVLSLGSGKEGWSFRLGAA